MFKYVLFDLDGTLTDPKEGICKSVQYALHRCGVEEPDIDRLEPFIGPPLKDSFALFYQFDQDTIEKAVAAYRERFSMVGLYENLIYPGIAEMLADLKEDGAKLAIASSKPTVFVEKIIDHFGIAEYFDAVIGSELDGRRSDKTEVVKEALLSLYYGNDHEEKGVTELGDKSESYKKETAMVGDRMFDIKGARDMGVTAVGVDYGYAAKGELKKAGADHIAKDVPQLYEILSGKKKEKIKKTVVKDTEKKVNPLKKRITEPPKSSFLRAVYVLTPFALYYLSMMATMTICINMYDRYIASGKAINEHIFGVRGAYLSGYIQGLSMLMGGVVLILMYHSTDFLPIKIKDKSKLKITALTIPVGITGAIGLNLLIGYICSWIPALSIYVEAGKYNNDIPLIVGIFCYILIAPPVEELIFRYLIFGRSEKFLGTGLAMFAQALFFGLYHGNPLQGIYAFVMGYVIVYAYKKSGSIIAAFLLHMSANAAVYLSPLLSESIQKVITGPIFCVLFLTIAAAGVILMGKISKKES